MRKNQELMRVWGKIDKETRQQFMKDNADTMGEDLAKRMQETVTEYKIHNETTEWLQNSEFRDKEDMTAKYKDKPDQLESIWKNAKKIRCPIRGVDVWQDPQFKLKHSDKVTHERIEERRMSQEAIVAPKAKARPKRAATIADVSEDNGPPMLKCGEKSKIKRLSQSFKELIQKMSVSIKRITDEHLQEMVPKWVIDKAKQQLLLIQSEESAAAIVLHGNRCQDALDMIQKGKEKLAAATKVSQSLENMIAEAVEHSIFNTLA